MSSSNTKICNRCHTDQLRENFYKLSGKKYKDSWDCRDSVCKKCKSEIVSEKRLNIKKKAVLYKGGKCIDCGLESTHYFIYDFHHRDPSKKDLSLANSMTTSFEKLLPELDKCDLLCSNCHRIRHYS